MKKIYYLGSCDTCKRILGELAPLEGFVLQDIKTENIAPSQLEEMKDMTGSYGALFSKRARLYKERNLAAAGLKEEELKTLILEHYTFLKRPVILVDGQIFVGNSPNTVTAAKKAIHP